MTNAQPVWHPRMVIPQATLGQKMIDEALGDVVLSKRLPIIKSKPTSTLQVS